MKAVDDTSLDLDRFVRNARSSLMLEMTKRSFNSVGYVVGQRDDFHWAARQGTTNSCCFLSSG